MNLKNDFPLISGSNLSYLDNAATTQKPARVIDSMNKFYLINNANTHSGLYDLSEAATKLYEESREAIAEFINADSDEIVFTRGATESINVISRTLPALFGDKTHIIVSEMEHHSNFVPWQQLAKNNNYILNVIKMNSKFEIDYEELERGISKNTAVVAISHVSNALGTIHDIKRIIDIAHKHNAFVLIDASQSIPHIPIDVKKLDCDFLVFSGHKMYGPLGIGDLYGKKEFLDKIPPFLYGGDMIESVTVERTTFAKYPKKFEAGTQNIAGAVGLAEAVRYIKDKTLEAIAEHEANLLKYTLNKLSKIPGIVIYSPKHNAGIISFNIPPIHPHDLASILNDYNVAIRAGHHCCMPLMNKLSLPGTVRISLACYNTYEDIDALINGLNKALEILK